MISIGRRAILIGALALVLAGCAASKDDRVLDPSARIDKIGVISLLGDTVQFQYAGAMDLFFGVGTTNEDLQPDWGLDALIAERVVATLSGRFSASIVSVEPTQFRAATGQPRAIPIKALHDGVLGLPPSDIDAYVVVRPITLAMARYSWTGLVVNGGSGDTQLMANYQITVIEAKTGQPLASGTGEVRGGALIGNMRPLIKCQKALWADKIAQLTDDQKRMIKDEMTKLLTASLPLALENAGLIDHADALKQEALSEKFTMCSRY